MALAQEIEEWTRDKPSLVQIRTTARLSQASLRPSPNGTVQDFANAKEILRQGRVNRLRQAALLDEQKPLRGHANDLRRQQRGLLKLLRRNVEARRP